MNRRALLPVIVGIVPLAFNGCSCQQSNYKQLSSPDAKYVLIERELNCSALDPYRVTLSIQSTNPRFGVAWLGFPKEEVFAADVSLRDTRIKWLDNREVEVVCTDCEKYGVATRIEAWKDVRIRFDVGKAGKGVY